MPFISNPVDPLLLPFPFLNLAPPAMLAIDQCCIIVIQARLEEHKRMFPTGFMLFIYGTSVGSHTIVQEGNLHLTGRGYHATRPPADRRRRRGGIIPRALQSSYGPPGEMVLYCGKSKVLSKSAETAAQAHFTKICDTSNGMMPRTWRVVGAGEPKGIAPYYVCIRDSASCRCRCRMAGTAPSDRTPLSLSVPPLPATPSCTPSLRSRRESARTGLACDVSH